MKNRKEKRWSLIALAFSLLCTLALLQGTFVKAGTTDVKLANNAKNSNFQSVGLAGGGISPAFSNLSIAEQLWNSSFKAFVDTRYCGKQIAFDPSLHIDFTIRNYTSDEPDFLHGGVIHDVSHIWLRYNDTVWIEASSLSASPAPLQTGTWALGFYSDPGQRSGNNPVSGVLSWGAWSNWQPSSSSYYLGADVLSMYDGAYVFQIAEAADQTGYYIAVQAWNSSGLQYSNEWTVTGFTLNCDYPLRIQYVSSSNGWNFYFNNLLLLTISDGRSQIQKGNQPNVVVETNDYSSGDFTNYLCHIGHVYIPSFIANPAIAYYYSGGWYPVTLGFEPYAYAYWGGDQTHGVIFSVGNNGPPNWFGEEANLFGAHIRAPQPYPEQVWVGSQLSQPTDGTWLWG